MMVLNGAAVLRRCLMPLRGVVDEIVVVDTGSTDGTREVLEGIASDLQLARYRYERLHPCSPAFLTDEADTWRARLPGPFTGGRIPKDWAEIRNGLLNETTADYVLKLDADDEPTSPPENWLRTCDMLDQPDCKTDLVSCPYEICDGKGEVTWLSMYDRLWRRRSRVSPPLRWVQPCHEMLAGKTAQSVLYAAQGLRVRDHRDSPGDGVRIAHRNLKVLLWSYENGERRLHHGAGRTGYSMAHAHLVESFTLAHEAAEVLPELAHELLIGVMMGLGSSDPGMRADCLYHLGRVYEEQWRRSAGSAVVSALLDRAAEFYAKADAALPHAQALLKLHSLLRLRGDVVGAEALRPKILEKVGEISGSLPFNCDLSLLGEIRTERVA
jgi:hypothetical protein